MLVCFMLIMFLHFVNAQTCTEEMYSDYLTYWSRNFTQQKLHPDFTNRFNVYCQNRKYSNQINSQNLGYTLSLNWKWMDKTQEQKKELIRVQFTPEALAATASQRPQNPDLRKVSSVPNSVDYRTSGDVSSIKDQGSCGCCWSFTTVGLYESWMMLKGQSEYDLSQQYLLQCTTKFTQNVLNLNLNSSCQGGYVDFAGELARVNGIPLQSKFPYISASFTGSGFPTTPNICEANESIMYARDPDVTKFYINRNNTQANMKVLLSKGPAAALIYSNTGFQAYQSGVYSGCPPSFATSYTNINHAVIIVGYDSNGNYIIKNSWGTSWGQNGFGVVSKDADCGLSAFVFQYESTASPGNGVVFSRQTNLNGGSNSQTYLRFTFMILGLLAILALF